MVTLSPSIYMNWRRLLVHLSLRLKCTFKCFVRCLSLTLHIFDFFTENAERNSTKLDNEQDFKRPLPSLCFSSRSEKPDERPNLWLTETFSTSPLTPLNSSQGNNILISSTKFVLFRSIRKIRWLPWPLIGSDIFNFSSETAERSSTKLVRQQDFNILYQVCDFRADRKNKMVAPASDWLRH